MPTPATGKPGCLAEDFGGHSVEVNPLGDRLMVRAVSGRDHVLGSE